MRKVSQTTEFDQIIGPEPFYTHNAPKQRLLFPEEKPYYYGGSQKEEAIMPPEKEPEPFKLVYPEVEPEHIRTNMSPKVVQREEERQLPPEEHDPEIATPNVEQLNSAAKNKILAKYNTLRQTAIKFYALYQEANLIAESDDFQINLDTTYADFFAQYGKLVTHKLTQEIGRLFGTGLKRNNGLAWYLRKGNLNIFNINSENYHSKLNEMSHLIKNFTDIIDNYERRKKLLKYIGPKIQGQADIILQNKEWLSFFSWMDEYFPNNKKEILNDSLKVLENNSYYRHANKSINFGDLIRIKTFKEIYEKAEKDTSETFRDRIEHHVTIEMKAEIKEQLYNRISRFFLRLVDLISNNDKTLPPEEQCNQIISFLRKAYNLDLRAAFTFGYNAYKKKLTSYYQKLKETNPTMDLDTDRLLNAELQNFYEDFIKKLLVIIKRFLSEKTDGTWIVGYGLGSAVDDLSSNLIKRYNKIDRTLLTQLLKYNSNDFDRISNEFVYSFILKSIIGFDNPSSYIEEDNPNTKNIKFNGISSIMQQSDGKFSIEAFTNYAYKHLSFLPREVISGSIKTMFRELDYQSLNFIYQLYDTNYKAIIKLIAFILQKNNKLDSNNFYKFFKNINKYVKLYSSLVVNFPKSFEEQEIFKIMTDGVRNNQTIDQDLENLSIFAKFLHNEAGTLSDDIIRGIIRNKNFINFNKIGIVKKLFKSYTLIKNTGGLKGIYSKYGKLITALREKKYISTNFRENISLVIKFFETNEEINPSSPIFSRLFEVSSKIESDLAILEMGDALKDLLKNYKTKTPKLFDLDYQMGNNLRFRVLRDKDPRILRIGIETDCCQRLGGGGEVAARDSFMNPLSSVLILEWLDPVDNEWKLLSQSYFHYVPEDNGYILDNIENNAKNRRTWQAANPNLSLEEIYGVYAAEMKTKLEINYFLSGKGYSTINAAQFDTDTRRDDPRFFDNRSLTPQRSTHYSDYDEHDGMNLLAPSFDIDGAKNKIFAETQKQAHRQIQRFIKAILHPVGFFKQAQTTPASTTTVPQTTPVVTAPLPVQDIKTLAGVNVRLFGPQSWNFINQFMNELNNDLFTLAGSQKLGNQTINFQTVAKNPTGGTRFTGSLKNLFKLSSTLWDIVTDSRAVPYTIVDAQGIIAKLMADINSSDFPEAAAQHIKPKLISILNNWSSILK